MRKPGNPRRVRVEVTASEAVALKRKRQHNALFNKGLDAGIREVEMMRRVQSDVLSDALLRQVAGQLLRLRRDT